MKKLMSLMLGMTIALGSFAAFAQDTSTEKKTTEKKKKSPKKKKDTTKTDTKS